MPRFIHISDTHLHTDANYLEEGAVYSSQVVLRALIDALRNSPYQPDFVLHTGDVVYRATPEAYQQIQEAMSQLGYPVYYVPGNLDDAALMPATPFYEVEIAGLQLVCLDSNDPDKPPYRGCISREQLEWLDTLCSQPDDRPLIVALHHLPLALGVAWLDNSMSLSNGDQLHRILLKARSRLKGVFHGHIHQKMTVVRDGMLYSCVSSGPFQFHGYAGMSPFQTEVNGQPNYSVVTVTPGQVFVRSCILNMPGR